MSTTSDESTISSQMTSDSTSDLVSSSSDTTTNAASYSSEASSDGITETSDSTTASETSSQTSYMSTVSDNLGSQPPEVNGEVDTAEFSITTLSESSGNDKKSTCIGIYICSSQ